MSFKYSKTFGTLGVRTFSISIQKMGYFIESWKNLYVSFLCFGCLFCYVKNDYYYWADKEVIIHRWQGKRTNLKREKTRKGNKVRHIFRKTSIFYPFTRTRICAYQGVKMFVFRRIWRALVSCYLRFKVRPFALSPTSCTSTYCSFWSLFSHRLSEYFVVTWPSRRFNIVFCSRSRN